jgi:hypothetical protein
MVDAPCHDWSRYDSLIERERVQWIRSLSPQQRYALYEDFFNLVHSAPRKALERERLEQWRWAEKLAMRLRLVDAFRKLDQYRRERAATNNAS